MKAVFVVISVIWAGASWAGASWAGASWAGNCPEMMHRSTTTLSFDGAVEPPVHIRRSTPAPVFDPTLNALGPPDLTKVEVPVAVGAGLGTATLTFPPPAPCAVGGPR